MKRTAFLFAIVLCFALTACSASSESNASSESSSPASEAAETSTPAPASSSESTPSADKQEDSTASQAPSAESDQNGDASNDANSAYTNSLEIQSYFPMQSNVHLVYDGSDLEYSDYECYVDYTSGNAIQYRRITTGATTLEVYKNEDGMLKKTFVSEEDEYRENFLNTKNTEEILLKAPVELGSTWVAKEGVTRTITATDVNVTVPLGSYEAVEVTVVGIGYTQKEYYAEGAGLIKSQYFFDDSDEALSTSELSAVEFNIPYIQSVTIYYPDHQTDGPVYGDKSIPFYTNSNPGKIISDAMKTTFDASGLIPTVPINAGIRGSYYDINTGVVTVDLSYNFISEMYASPADETTVLSCIANTFSRFYAAKHVSVTVNGEPYESDNYYFGGGDYVETDFDNSVAL